MRILLLADVHANWPALSAIQEPFDTCLFLGDLVDYGTDPVPCIDWIRQHAQAAVRGNHDHAVAQRIVARGGSGFRELAAATRPLNWQVLETTHLKYLARLPVTLNFELDGWRFLLVHATPRDPMDEYLIDDPAAWAARLQGFDVDFVCVGHSHVQFQLEVGAMRIVNPGSVGQPRDGDPRCAYAIIEDGEVRFGRVEYDIDATLRHMRDSQIAPHAVRLAESALRTGGRLPLPADGK